MSLANVRLALESLRDWVTAPGRDDRVVAIFGGNSGTRADLPELCAIVRETIPWKHAGFWSNRVFGHGEEVRKTFGYLNLVTHGVQRAAFEMQEAGLAPIHHSRHAMHAPVLVAMQDFIEDDGEIRRLAESCDIGVKWSGAIVENDDGTLGAWYCEVASAMARLKPELQRLALPVEPGWWRRPIEDYEQQVRAACRLCGVPLRLAGRVDSDEIDDVSPTWAHVAKLRPKRDVRVHETLPDGRTVDVVDYLRARS